MAPKTKPPSPSHHFPLSYPSIAELQRRNQNQQFSHAARQITSPKLDFERALFRPLLHTHKPGGVGTCLEHIRAGRGEGFGSTFWRNMPKKGEQDRLFVVKVRS